MQNTSKIKPFEFNVLLTFEEAPDKIGSFIIPDEYKDRKSYADMEATVVDISPAAFSYHDWPENVTLPKAGDRVMFSRHAGNIIDGKDGKKYRIVKDKDIAALVA